MRVMLADCFKRASRALEIVFEVSIWMLDTRSMMQKQSPLQETCRGLVVFSNDVRLANDRQRLRQYNITSCELVHVRARSLLHNLRHCGRPTQSVYSFVRASQHLGCHTESSYKVTDHVVYLKLNICVVWNAEAEFELSCR